MNSLGHLSHFMTAPTQAHVSHILLRALLIVAAKTYLKKKLCTEDKDLHFQWSFAICP